MLRHEQRREAAPFHSLPLAMKPLEISTPTIRWSELEIGRLLGSGSFSRVHEVSKTEGSVEFYDNLAIKMPLPLSANNETLDMAKEDLLNEATILGQLSHSNIISLLFVSDPSNPMFFLVVSRLDDTLDKRIEEWRKTKQLTKSFAAWKPQPFASRLEAVRARVEEVALGIANGLEYLHSKGIAHRDIKPQNVGFDEFDTVVLFDFGLSRQVRRGQQNSQEEQDLHKSLESIDFDMVSDDNDDIGSAVGSDGESSYYDLTRTSTGLAGSPRYMAPELVREEEYGLAVDTYSFGIMLWEIATLKQAFHRFRGVEALFENVHGGKRLRPDLTKNKCFASMSNFATLLHNMWQDESTKRPSMQRVRVELEAIVEAQRRGQLDEGHGPQARNGISRRDLFGRRASINMGRLSRLNQRGIKQKNSMGRRNSL